jgi:hypothetical protein
VGYISSVELLYYDYTGETKMNPTFNGLQMANCATQDR